VSLVFALARWCWLRLSTRDRLVREGSGFLH
jgi:hypothetical protein